MSDPLKFELLEDAGTLPDGTPIKRAAVNIWVGAEGSCVTVRLPCPMDWFSVSPDMADFLAQALAGQAAQARINKRGMS